MAITNYGELKTAIANWLQRDDLTTLIPDFVALAEDRIYTDPRMRVRAMEIIDSSFTVDSRSETLPTSYIAMRDIYLQTTPRRTLRYLTPFVFWGTYGSEVTGTPEVYTIEGENISFGPSPDSTYTATITYYGRPDAFSDDADTNTILTNSRGTYLYGSLLEACTYLEDDEQINKYSILFDDILTNLEHADRQDRFSGSPLVARTGVVGP